MTSSRWIAIVVAAMSLAGCAQHSTFNVASEDSTALLKTPSQLIVIAELDGVVLYNGSETAGYDLFAPNGQELKVAAGRHKLKIVTTVLAGNQRWISDVNVQLRAKHTYHFQNEGTGSAGEPILAMVEDETGSKLVLDVD